MGVPLLWDLCPKNMVPQMAGCHQTGYRGFTLEKSLSKSPRHQRSVNRVNPGVATRKCSLAWQGLANSKRDGDFCALEEMAMGNQPLWSPRNSWMLDLYLQDEATAKSANNMTILGCGSWGKTSTRFWEEHRFTMIYHLFWCSPKVSGFGDPTYHCDIHNRYTHYICSRCPNLEDVGFSKRIH